MQLWLLNEDDRVSIRSYMQLVNLCTYLYNCVATQLLYSWLQSHSNQPRFHKIQLDSQLVISICLYCELNHECVYCGLYVMYHVHGYMISTIHQYSYVWLISYDCDAVCSLVSWPAMYSFLLNKHLMIFHLKVSCLYDAITI